MGALKVMLVDDEQEFATTLAERLRMRGMDTVTAFDGEDALKMVSVQKPHVIVLDIMMPGIDGISFTKKLKSDINYSHIPLILLSCAKKDIPRFELFQVRRLRNNEYLILYGLY